MKPRIVKQKGDRRWVRTRFVRLRSPATSETITVYPDLVARGGSLGGAYIWRKPGKGDDPHASWSHKSILKDWKVVGRGTAVVEWW